ncbi:regulatory protein PchR [Clostridium homopropionicum DSM 5847]|uniref:Regulatory protein PchR n=1 Tax=Clostridium homopropionicum DSM 5847 TaxID=1121318 RepID=A0A0L6Z8K4_9CLOT|nr:AraC family transcriptional regulator [Clostridium homopropionicum]KOA19300.1 regulatory protein PchR [Clostridium homopropionicum DSM 5847]SFG20327.1 transcriptional regulator, AraC family [Clostridium homopropionicum]
MNKFDRRTELIHGLETNYLRVLYYDFNDKYKGEYKSYESSRLCTIIDGEKKVKINNDNVFTYNDKEFIILPPNSTVNLEINTPTKALVFEIYNSLIDSVTKKVCMEFENDLNCDIKKHILYEKVNPIIHNSIQRILNTALSNEKNKEFLVDLYAQEMAYNLIKIKSVHDMLNINSNNFIHLSIKIMHENISEGITISEIAYALNMSPANFSAKFKKVIGVSPNEYFKNLKLLEAKKMLKVKNVTEVAYDLGYDNISYFIGLFKDRFGITPKQYILNESNEKYIKRKF